MGIFKQDNNKCYFIHIPRTGGRYISQLFEFNEVECSYHKINEYQARGIDSTHLHYPLYNHFLKVKDIPHITIVRNPLDKFYSCIKNMHFIHKIDYNKFMTSWDKFYDFVTIQIEIQSYHNNWFLPQHKFISNKTHIWKYENGFGKNFVEWIFEKTKIKLTNIDDIKYDEFAGEFQKNNKSYRLNKNIEKYVQIFYKQDYELFDYDL